jgi:hypothetical protein
MPIPVVPSGLGEVFKALGNAAEAIATTVTEAITTTTVTVAAGAAYLISPGSGGGNNQNDTIQYKGGPDLPPFSAHGIIRRFGL